MPFFTYYGGKHRATKHYPPPLHDVIVEPFAGSAGYSLNYPDHHVLLYDLDDNVTSTWEYLLAATPDQIMALPDLEPDQTIRDLDLPRGAQNLIGWWLNKGSATPKLRASTFMLEHAAGAPYWGERIRERIATQLEHVRHWQVVNGRYDRAPDLLPATWFIDPPYQRAGRYYRFGANMLDYAALAQWCLSRPGQLIVCEADDADWLPFRPLTVIDGTEGRQKKSKARLEVVYLR